MELSVQDNPLQVICPKCKTVCKGSSSVIVPELLSPEERKTHLSNIVEANVQDCEFQDTLYFLPLLLTTLTSTFTLDLKDGNTFTDTQATSGKNLYGDPANAPEELRSFCKKVEIQYPNAAELEKLPIKKLTEIIAEYPNAIFIPTSSALLNAPELLSESEELRDKHFKALCAYGTKTYNDAKRFSNYRSETYNSSIIPDGIFYLFPIHAGTITVKRDGKTEIFKYKFHATSYAMCEEVMDCATQETYNENQPYGFSDFSQLISDKAAEKCLLALSPWLVLWFGVLVFGTIWGFFAQPFSEAILFPVGWLIISLGVLCIPYLAFYLFYHFKVSKSLLPFKNTIHTPLEAITARQQVKKAIDSVSWKGGLVVTLLGMVAVFFYINTQI